jgi:hypothetical protein
MIIILQGVFSSEQVMTNKSKYADLLGKMRNIYKFLCYSGSI